MSFEFNQFTWNCSLGWCKRFNLFKRSEAAMSPQSGIGAWDDRLMGRTTYHGMVAVASTQQHAVRCNSL